MRGPGCIYLGWCGGWGGGAGAREEVRLEINNPWSRGIIRLGVKRVTEPNRTEPTDYTGRSLRQFPIVAVPGFTSVTEPNPTNAIFTGYFIIISFQFIKLITFDSRFYLFKYHLLYLGSQIMR